MHAPHELNDLVDRGKADMQKYVRNHINMALVSGDEGHKRMTMTLSSLLLLSLRKGTSPLDVAHIRNLVIEENIGVLSALSDNDARVAPLLAVATGRVSQAQEYIAAIRRVGQTYINEAEEIYRYIHEFWDMLILAERAAVRLALAEAGEPVLLEIAVTGRTTAAAV